MPEKNLKTTIYKGSITQKYLDVMSIVLMLECRYTLIPELYNFLGRERFFEFITRFGGKTVTFPTKRSILSSIRNTEVYLKIRESENNNKSNLKEVTKELMDNHRLSYDQIRRIYREVGKVVEELMQCQT